MNFLSEESERYSQQLKLSELGREGQIKLKNAKVLCIGAGGLGSSLLFYLAAAGVGTLGIIDDDVVELSNLQRQILYQSSDIGKQKSLIARERLLALNPHLDVTTYSTRLTLQNAATIIADYDIVADCSDNFTTRYLVNDVCFFLKKPYLFASISQFQGQCAFFIPEQTSCFRCLFPSLPETHSFANCAQGGVLGVLPGLLGILQATEIIKWVIGQGELLTNTLLTVDLLTTRFQKYYLSQSHSCKTCVLHEPPEKLNFQAAVSNINELGISAQELKLKIEKGESFFLIDVRSPEEHHQENLGGTSIPLPELNNHLSRLDPNQEIIVYCQSGPRSIKGLELLVANNFSSVKFLKDGLTAWQAASQAPVQLNGQWNDVA